MTKAVALEMCNKVKRATRKVLHKYFGPSFNIESSPDGFEFTGPDEIQVSGYDRPGMPVMISMNPQRWEWMEWGLVPRNIDQMPNSRAKEMPVLNAKAETLLQLPTFRDSARLRRCIIPIECFYEHQHITGAGKKKTQQYRIDNEDGLMFIAGIWDEYNGIKTFAKITTAANPLMAEIHNSKERQPHQIGPDHWERWLGPLSDAEVMQMLEVYPDDDMRAEKYDAPPPPKPDRPADPGMLF